MKPLIGITTSITSIHNDPRYQPFDATYLPHYLVTAVEKAGGIPIAIPILNIDNLEEITQGLDGLILSGGHDLDPSYYQEEPHPNLGPIFPARDRHEMNLIRQFYPLNKPILGICRGMQLLNIAFGGSLYQDLSQNPSIQIQHCQSSEMEYSTHSINIAEDSFLKSLISDDNRVNSVHHQIIKQLAPSLKAIAWSQDQVIEALEDRDHPFLLGLQWHPEYTYNYSPASQAIFNCFIEACQK